MNSYPTSFPPQHQTHHPGFEYEMNPKPVFDNETLMEGSLLENKVAIITGGDSGIGKSVAIAYAKQGANVVIVYKNESQDATETQSIIKKYGKECICIETDLSIPANCQHIVEQTMKHFGKIDILVHNAAVQYTQPTFDQIPHAQFDQTFKTNVYGPYYLTQAALPHLKKGACIIITTSVVAFRGHDTLIDYSMTKGALVAMTRSLSTNLAKSQSGIRVNAVAPGPIWTPLIPSSFDASKVSTFGQDTPLGRAGQPVECAGAYVFLASDAASYITGQTIHINGGEIVNA